MAKLEDMASASPMYLPAKKGMSARHVSLLIPCRQPTTVAQRKSYLSSNIFSTARVGAEASAEAAGLRYPIESSRSDRPRVLREGRGARAGRDSEGNQRETQQGLCLHRIRELRFYNRWVL